MKKLNDIERKSSTEASLIGSLKIVVDGVAKTFGHRWEAVLHHIGNVRNLDHLIVKIANGYVTGRIAGESMTDQGLQGLRSGCEDALFVNYASITEDGKPLKSMPSCSETIRKSQLHQFASTLA